MVNGMHGPYGISGRDGCFVAAILVTGVLLPMQYPWIGSGGFALLGLHVTLVVMMLFVLRVGGVRMGLACDGSRHCFEPNALASGL